MDKEVVVVAVPDDNDPVWKFSSEKVPHMTLLYLGEPDWTPEQLAHVTQYIAHAASQLSYFGMEVYKRDELGPKRADVLFFSKKWARNMVDFRSHLLQDQLINIAYHAADQWPDWTPHLTMGFPETPAKKDDREYNRFSYVRFDRISIWTGDSVGPTFKLKADEHDLEVAMSERGAAAAAEFLEHYGVKGMKWGVRKKGAPRDGVADGKVAVTVTDKGKLKAAGGRKFKPAEEAIATTRDLQIARKSGVKSLSNKQLQDAVTRMNLEQQFVRLAPQSRRQKVNKFVAETMLGIGKQQVSRVANDVAAQQVAKAMKRTK